MGISNRKEIFSVLKGCRKRLTLLLFVNNTTNTSVIKHALIPNGWVGAEWVGGWVVGWCGGGWWWWWSGGEGKGA